MQNPDDYNDYQVLGANIQTILDGFGSFTLLASKILLDVGLGTVDDEGIGLVKLDPTHWYPVSSLIRAMDRVQAEFGEYTIKQAGLFVAKRAKQVGDAHFRDIETAMKLMGAGYHINHAKNFVPMFNPQTGEIIEGIGNYNLRPVTGKGELIFDVDALYPCAFAAGIVEGVALLFDPKAKLVHDPKACRKKGSPICTYRVTYNIPGKK
ncbi:hypothetical protein [Hyalangium sp.]|uniref:hypothetical protein n=1 Tax=Hyalangium sp. TaxID=2028555 RepID=UPI002D6DA1D9|nr:hypothetical protein [Hyalangium sp.]HYH94563.1 hypothetical protein [Hyalangium sp.]